MANRDEVLRKLQEGNLSVSDMMDPEVLAIAQQHIEEKHPGLLSGMTAEDLLNDPGIQRAIEESVQEELQRRQPKDQ